MPICPKHREDATALQGCKRSKGWEMARRHSCDMDGVALIRGRSYLVGKLKKEKKKRNYEAHITTVPNFIELCVLCTGMHPKRAPGADCCPEAPPRAVVVPSAVGSWSPLQEILSLAFQHTVQRHFLNCDLNNKYVRLVAYFLTNNSNRHYFPC